MENTIRNIDKMKIKFIIKSFIQKDQLCLCSFSKSIEDCFTCFEIIFDPILNVKQMIFLLEYCKPLLESESKEDYYKILDELFGLQSDGKSVKDYELGIVPYEKNGDYDNFCIIDLNENAYIFVKRYKFMDNMFISSAKDWLKLHYPLEQFIDCDNQLDEEGIEICSLIEEVNDKKINVLDEYNVMYILK
jgi:hypothetical protein